MNEIVILIIGYAIGAISVSLAYAIRESRKFGEYEDE